jgi:hypothetical protein
MSNIEDANQDSRGTKKRKYADTVDESVVVPIDSEASLDPTPTVTAPVKCMNHMTTTCDTTQ